MLNSDSLPLECLYYGYTYEKLVLGLEKMFQGDHLFITNKGKYISKKGWFIFVFINGKRSLVRMKDIEENITNDMVKPLIDLELEKNFLNYQIDKSLLERDSYIFYESIQRLKKLNVIYRRMKKGIVEKEY